MGDWIVVGMVRGRGPAAVLLALVAAGHLADPGPARAEDWPQWRGPNRDARVSGFVAPASWPKALTKKWTVTVGEAVASPVLANNRVYVFTRKGGDEVLTCLDAATGNQVWQDKYASSPVRGVAGGFRGSESFKGPRSTPAVGEGKVCALGVNGTVSCLGADKGGLVWRKNTMSKPRFYTSSSPLIAEGKCVVLLGSDEAELTAYNLASGKQEWKWVGDEPSYGSPVLATIGGTKQVVTPTKNNLVGVRLEDGKLLWKATLPPAKYSTGTPVVDGNTVICTGAAYRVEKKGDKFAVSDVWQDRAPATYNTPVLRDGLLYGLTGRGRGATNLYCQDARTGKVLWTNKAPRGECGEVLAAGPVLVLLSSNSDLVVFKPSKAGYEELARYKVADTPTWAYPIIDGNRVFVKDRNSITLWMIE
jgi:outer membrane protein assembly factor BamB